MRLEWDFPLPLSLAKSTNNPTVLKSFIFPLPNRIDTYSSSTNQFLSPQYFKSSFLPLLLPPRTHLINPLLQHLLHSPLIRPRTPITPHIHRYNFPINLTQQTLGHEFELLP